jgi:hypothetical protein
MSLDPTERKDQTQRVKEITDWGMLIATCIAALFAGWAALEAHQSRLSADKTAKDALNAQIQIMQIDQRPYIKVIRKISDLSYDGAQIVFTVRMQMEASGRLPALKIAAQYVCQTNRKYEKTSGLQPYLIGSHLEAYRGILNAAQNIEFGCATTVDSSVRNALIIGIASYKDLFKINHQTPFCYQADFPDFTGLLRSYKVLNVPTYPCPDFEPEIT